MNIVKTITSAIKNFKPGEFIKAQSGNIMFGASMLLGHKQNKDAIRQSKYESAKNELRQVLNQRQADNFNKL